MASTKTAFITNLTFIRPSLYNNNMVRLFIHKDTKSKTTAIDRASINP